MSYDYRCWDLAGLFIRDSGKSYTEADMEALAQLIQTTIEDFIAHDLAPTATVVPPAEDP